MALAATAHRDSARPAQGRPGRLRQSVAGVYAGRRKLATVAAGLLAIALFYHVVFGQNGLIGYEQKRMDTRTLDTELNNLERENEGLKGHVDRLQRDPDAIEHQAREELHYTRPGEVIYTLPAPVPAKAQTTAK